MMNFIPIPGTVRKTGYSPRASTGLCHFTNSVGEFAVSGNSFSDLALYGYLFVVITF